MRCQAPGISVRRFKVTANIVAYLCCDGASEAIAWYSKAFGAREISRMTDDGGRIGHAEIEIAGTMLYVSAEWPENRVLSPKHLGGVGVSFVMTVPDADAAFERAVAAGAKVDRTVRDEPHGRAGWVWDPWGHHWNLLALPTRGVE
jgi:PhnB protein